MNVTKSRSKDGRINYRLDEAIDWIVPGDIHLPLTNWNALKACLRDTRGDYPFGKIGLFITGDLFDNYWISSWGKTTQLNKIAGYNNSREATKDFVAATRDFDVVVLGGGNHEARAASLSSKYPGFDGNLWWLYQDLLPTNWVYLDHGYRCSLPQKSVSGLPIVLEHGDKCFYSGIPSAQKLVVSYPNQCTMIGHNHRIETAHKTTWSNGKPHLTSAYSVGHLQSLKNNTWTNNPNWQLGWGRISSTGEMSTHVYYEGRVN